MAKTLNEIQGDTKRFQKEVEMTQVLRNDQLDLSEKAHIQPGFADTFLRYPPTVQYVSSES